MVGYPGGKWYVCVFEHKDEVLSLSKQDNSDTQYASFRDNIPYMALVVILHPTIRRCYEFLNPVKLSGNSKPATESEAASRLARRVSFDIAFSAIFLVALHGFSSVKVFLILYVNFFLATNLQRQYIPIVTWVFNIGVLFTNEVFHGYPYASIAQSLYVYDTGKTFTSRWGSYLDSYGGLIPRWEILFNITVLRLISFNLDYYWSLGSTNSGNALEVSCDMRSKV